MHHLIDNLEDVKCRVAAVKNTLFFATVLLHFPGLLGSLIQELLSVEN
jgi:hypothetical protein